MEEDNKKASKTMERQNTSKLPDYEYERVLRELDEFTDIASIAAFSARNAILLFHKGGKESVRIIEEIVPKDLLLEAGLLIEPEEIPEEGPRHLIALYARPTETSQKVDKSVIYLGDVILSLEKGFAQVHGSSQLCSVSGDATLLAHGDTWVTATENARVALFDTARCSASGHSEITAFGKSLVHSEGNTRLFLANQSRTVVEKGSPRITLEEETRCFIEKEAGHGRPINIEINGSPVLCSAADPESLRITSLDAQATLVQVHGKSIEAEALLRGIVITKPIVEHPFEEPLPIDTLKRDILLKWIHWNIPILAKEIKEASTEEELCRIVASAILSDQGKKIDGEFLRRHFTEKTLLACGIHAFSAKRPITSSCANPLFFGDGLVFADDYPLGLRAYENTLVIKRRKNFGVSLFQKSGLIDLGDGISRCDDQSKVFAAGRSVAKLHGEATGALIERSGGLIKGNSLAYAEDKSHVMVFDEAAVILRGEASADLHAHSTALVEGRNLVIGCRAGLLVTASFLPTFCPRIDRQCLRTKELDFNNKEEYEAFKEQLLTKRRSENYQN